MTSLWYSPGLCFGRSLSPIIRQWMYITEYAWAFQGCFWHCIWHDKCRLLWQAFDIHQGYVSGGACLPSSGSECILLNTFDFIKAVSDTVFDMINVVYYDKPLIFTRAMFREKLVSHHQAVNVYCWIRLSFSRLYVYCSYNLTKWAALYFPLHYMHLRQIKFASGNIATFLCAFAYAAVSITPGIIWVGISLTCAIFGSAKQPMIRWDWELVPRGKSFPARRAVEAVSVKYQVLWFYYQWVFIQFFFAAVASYFE